MSTTCRRVTTWEKYIWSATMLASVCRAVSAPSTGMIVLRFSMRPPRNDRFAWQTTGEVLSTPQPARAVERSTPGALGRGRFLGGALPSRAGGQSAGSRMGDSGLHSADAVIINQFRQEQNQVRPIGQQKQDGNLEQQERQHCLGHVDQVPIDDRPGDIEADSERRRAVADAQVQSHQQAEMHGVDAELTEQG